MSEAQAPIGGWIFAVSAVVALSRLRRKSRDRVGTVVPLYLNHTDEFTFAKYPLDLVQVELRVRLLDWLAGDEEFTCTYDTDRLRCVLDVHQLVGGSTSTEERYKDVVHSEVYCDLCLQRQDRDEQTSYSLSPIRGICHRCLECDDFDCCDSCKRQAEQDDPSVCGCEGHVVCSLKHSIVSGRALVRRGSYADCLVNILLNYGGLPALGYMDYKDRNVGSVFTWYSYKDIYNYVLSIGAGMQAMSVTAQQFILICASNSVEYMILDFVCGIFGFIMVPVSPSAAPDLMADIYCQLGGNSNCCTLVCSVDTYEKIASQGRQLWPEGSEFNLIVLHSLKRKNELPSMCVDIPNCKQVSLSALCELGDSAPQPYPQRIYDGVEEHSALAAIAFTSGTTAGALKGIPITIKHRMNTLLRYSHNYESSRVARDVSLVFTNMSYHTVRDELLYLMLGGGQGVVFTPPAISANEEANDYRDSTFSLLVKQFSLLRPTFIVAVPAFWIELYNQYTGDLDEACANLDPSADDFDETKLMCKRVIDSGYAAMFGGRLVEVSTGSAHTPAAVYDFLQRVVGNASLAQGDKAVRYMPRQVFEGYGAMEVGGIASNNLFLSTVDWKVVLDSENTTISGDADANNDKLKLIRGQLYVKTAQMTSAYFCNEGMSEHWYDEDGYFATGDIVQLDCHCGGANTELHDSQYSIPAVVTQSFYRCSCACMGVGGPRVTVIGRATAMLKLSDGEMISPELIEGVLIDCLHIEEVFVYAEIDWLGVVAVVVVPPYLLEARGRTDNALPSTAEGIIWNEMNELVGGEKLSAKHCPRAIVLTSAPFTVASGLLTVSMKKCRKNLISKYKAVLTEAYRKSQVQSIGVTIANIVGPLLHPDSSEDIALSRTVSIWRQGLTSLTAAAIASKMSNQLRMSTEKSLSLLMSADTVDSLSALVVEHHSEALDGCSADSINADQSSLLNRWKNVAKDDLSWTFRSTEHLSILSGNRILNFPSVAKRTILVTGGNGFLGSMIIRKLLEHSSYNIVALVRGAVIDGKDVSGESRLLSELRKHNCAERDSGTLAKFPNLLVVEGDICSPRFGVTSNLYSELSLRIDSIVHCAAATSFSASYMQLRDANVLATQNVISLALCNSIRTIPIHFVSTLSAAYSVKECDAFCYYEYERVVRAELNYANSNDRGYMLSKAISECLVRRAGFVNGLPFTIIRPGTISAHGVSGYSNATDFTTRLLRSMTASRRVPYTVLDNCDMNGSVDLAEVSYVANYVVHVVQLEQELLGHTLHICNSNLVHFRDIVDAAEAYLSSANDRAHDVKLPIQKWVADINSNSWDPLHFLSGDVSNILCCAQDSRMPFRTTDLRYLLSMLAPESVSRVHDLDAAPPTINVANFVRVVMTWISDVHPLESK